MNTLYYGDNLDILREYVKDESVDLVYLDPPFNSNRNYNVLFKDESGKEAEAQITAFEDTWHWNEKAEETYQALVTEGAENISNMIGALRQFIGTNQMTAYLVMMAARLVELHRVLKPTGSLYLHCDPTASHYLKILLDTIFGARNFVNEIVWKRSDAHNDAKQGAKHFGRVHDVLLFYARSDGPIFKALYNPLPQSTVDSWYRNVEPGTGRRFNKADVTGPGGAAKGNPYYEWKGITRYWRYNREKMERLEAEGRLVYSKSGMVYEKRYLDESKGVAVQDWWDDIEMLRGISGSGERLGYPTQKPTALLERIVSASSNEGDTVLDPFCGCGTTIAAAQKLNRNWIGIDITHLSIALQKYRLKDAFGIVEKKDYRVIGEPEDLASAQQLAEDDRYQFQWWALSLIKARPLGGEAGSKQGKKGSDKGIDGVITFIDDTSNKPKRAIVQVKSGKVKSGDIRDLKGTVEREKAAMGIFLTLDSPSKDMKTEAASAGFYHSPGWNKDYPRIQILTIEELFKGAEVKMPPWTSTFKQAQAESSDKSEQAHLF
jgi:site-specific DNA-methyltransferase (adenine-specific)